MFISFVSYNDISRNPKGIECHNTDDLFTVADVINKNCEGLALKFSESKKNDVYRKMLEFIAEFTSFHFHTDLFLKINNINFWVQ